MPDPAKQCWLDLGEHIADAWRELCEECRYCGLCMHRWRDAYVNRDSGPFPCCLHWRTVDKGNGMLKGRSTDSANWKLQAAAVAGERLDRHERRACGIRVGGVVEPGLQARR